MNNATEIIKSVFDGDLFDESTWNSDESGYESFNSAGVECEVGEFLHSMVRVLKPDFVLETGTHKGIGSMYIAMGLRDNKKGKLTTIEFNKEFFDESVKRFEKLGVSEYIEARNQDVRTFKSQDRYGMILLDTEPDLRFDELRRYWGNLEDGGYMFIHDLHRHMQQLDNPEHGFAWPFGEITTFMKDIIRTDKARVFHFPTPRGLTGFYKVHPTDYKLSIEDGFFINQPHTYTLGHYQALLMDF